MPLKPNSLQRDQDGLCRKEGISVIIPCFRESPAIVEMTVRGIRESLQNLPDLEFEIIVVDDGTDSVDYRKIVESAGAHLIRHRINRGYGASIATGIRSASFPWIGIIDADGTYPHDRFPELINEAGPYEMVIGARRWRDIEWIRRPAKSAMTLVASYLTNYRIPDLNSGMRVFHRRIYDEHHRIFPQRFSFSSTLTMAALTYLHDVRFITVPYGKRVGTSSISPIRDTARFFYQLFRLSLYFRPLRVFIPLSAAFGVLATARGLRDYLLHSAFGGLTLILFFMAFQVFFFGLIAEIINKK